MRTVLELQTDKVISELKEGRRIDERALDEYREIKISGKVSENADGSARVRLGKTDVIAGIKMVPGEPYPDVPDEGTIIVGMELLALASPTFESGPPNENAVELARVVDRGIRESKALNFKELCITEGEQVWIAFIDLYALNYDGNLFDACSLASLLALHETRMPKLEDKKIVKGEYSGKLKLLRKPVTSTFAKVSSTILLDPLLAEENVMGARFSVATTEDNFICAFQKGGGGSFTADELNNCVETALKKGKELRKLI